MTDGPLTDPAKPTLPPREPARVAPPPPRRNRGRLVRLVLGGLIVMIAVAFLLHREPSSTTTTEATEATKESAAPATFEPAVQVMKPLRRDMARSLTLPANIAPWYQTTLYAKVSGYLKEMRVDKGDRVKKGQIIALIDAPEVSDQYEQAKVDHAIKLLTYERLAGVFKENPDVIAKQDVDVAKAAADAAKHLMETRRTFLLYTRVDAPFDGTITARFADPGALIQAATGSASQSTPLYTIMSVDTLRIYVSVPQEDAPWARTGVQAKLNVKELPGSEYRSTITRTTEALDPNTRTLLVEIDLPNKDHRLQPGMYVTATLYLDQHPQALAIPPAAVSTEAGGKQKSVFVVDQGVVHKTAIKTGIDDGVWVQVLEGLSGTEDVVVVGRANVTDGQKVQSKPYSLPSGTPGHQKM